MELTCSIWKLNTTDIAISLSGIVPNFSFSINSKFCCISGYEFDDDDEDDDY